MSICVFFGHRDCPESVKGVLQAAIEELIWQGVDTFYVGDSGRFDAYVRATLKAVQAKHPHIRYAVVLAYLPSAGQTEHPTLYPEGVEQGPVRFAVERRNRWLVHQADYVLCYVDRPYGGAHKFARLAKRKGKPVINLSGKDV